jgi:hypothetical protein
MLLLLDSGDDSIENIDVVLEHNQQKVEPVLILVTANESWSRPSTPRCWKGYDYQIQQVIRLIERTIDKHVQSLLIP